MSCSIDEILNESSKTVEAGLEHLLHDLAVDFNLELDVTELLSAPETARLRGAMQTFVVWVVQHGRRQSVAG
ncbi:MAG: hypothetical protein H7837_03880 [Magnetococcus sp. MYC-9]